MQQQPVRVLLVSANAEDDALIRAALDGTKGARFALTASAQPARDAGLLSGDGADVVLLGIDPAGDNGLDELTRLREQAPSAPIVVLCDLDAQALAVELVQAGAQDYLIRGHLASDLVCRVLLYAVESKRAHDELSRIYAAVNDATNAILVTDRRGRAVFANRAFGDLFGLDLDAVTKAGISALCSGHDMAPHILDALADGANWQGELAMRSGSGRHFPATLHATAITDHGHEVVGMLFVVTDVTERTEAENALRASEEKYRRLVEGADIGICTADSRGTFLQANRAAARQYGMTANRLVGKTLWDVLPEMEADNLHEDIQRVIAGRESITTDMRLRVDGEHRWYTINIQSLITSKGEAPCVHIFTRDITEHKRTEERLLYEATHDHLTGLFNRRYFMERLQGAIRSAKRYDYPLSLCVCDLDNFKTINDVHGHVAGDEVLARFGEMIAGQLRGDDIAGRYGGDEFWIILPHTPASEAVRSIERIGSRFENQVFRALGGEAFSVTATFGVADLLSPEMTEQELLVAADQALYQGKAAGGNRIIVKRH